MQSAVSGGLNELIDIGALERILAGKGKDRGTQIGNVIDQLFCLIGGQFQRMTTGVPGRNTLWVYQLTSLPVGFPDDDEGRFINIKTVFHSGKSLVPLGG